MSKTTAVCEHTKKSILLYDGCYVGNYKTGEWMFCSNKAADALGQYSIRVTELSERPEALLDWMAHLNEKRGLILRNSLLSLNDFEKKIVFTVVNYVKTWLL